LIGATFTATPIAEPLQFWISELGLSERIDFLPYRQLFQTLLDPASVFSRNEHGVNVALFRLEDLAAEGALADIERHARELSDALRGAALASRVPLIACLCPPSSRFLETEESPRFSERLERELSESLDGRPNLCWLGSGEVIARYQVMSIEDPIAERTGHVPYHRSFFAALGTEILRVALATERRPVKVIICDCDNTLWTGVCGEDGPLNVMIDSGRRTLQRFLQAQKDAGTLLAIASKNNEADVRETFSSHAGMALAWSDIVAHRINWESKSRNLLELADELNLGLDSFVFLDDDAKECAEVRSELPEVTTLQLPHSSGAIGGFLDHAWIFDRTKTATTEDQTRSQMYAEHLERNRFEKQARDLREFLAGLRLEIVFAPLTPDSLARASQLTQRTNQMNASLRRYSESELKADLDSDLEAFTVTVSDRFGSYGLVGLVLFRTGAEALRIENILLSCRALGRGVEHKMIQHAAEIAEARGKRRIEIAIVEGPRNQPALNLLRDVGSATFTTSQQEYWVVEVTDARKLEFLDNPIESEAAMSPTAIGARERTQRGGPSIDYQRIAESLCSAANIEAAIQHKKREQSQAGNSTGAPPHTELQARLAAIWCVLLGVRAVGVDEDFFDLGGHSLLAVQLLSRIHEELGVDLPDAVIYGEKLRIDSLARAIELQELGITDQAAYDSMLEEIESLSDDEVAALLAEEESGS
jgi:FkbH-like protein